MGVQRARLSVCTGNRDLFFFTTSKTFQSGTSKRLMHFRYALDEVRSEKGEFLKQSGGLFEKEGKPCKRGLPLERTSDTEPRFRGALSLAERPSLAEQSPGLFCNSLPAERPACKHFGSREKFANIGFPCKRRALPSRHPQALF